MQKRGEPQRMVGFKVHESVWEKIAERARAEYDKGIQASPSPHLLVRRMIEEKFSRSE